MKPKVLWIEDSARLELRNLTGPVYFSGKYDFSLAEDVTQAINFLNSKQFEVLIVDLRLPPGLNQCWQKLYKKSNLDKVKAQLGMKLLYWLLGHDVGCEQIPPSWVKPENLAVFSVESRNEIASHLAELKIERFKQKEAGLPDTALLDLIEDVLRNNLR